MSQPQTKEFLYGGKQNPSLNGGDTKQQIELRESYIRKYFPRQRIDGLSQLKIYLPDFAETFPNKDGIQKVSVGEKSYSSSEKVILMIGETGTGKSTLVNSMVNYIFGIEREEDFRLQLVDEGDSDVDQAESQTKGITAYTIHHQSWFKVPFTLTVIDTPGMMDTGGVRRDEEIMRQLENFFRTTGVDGVDVLDAVGFTVRAPDARFTDSQKYIFNRINSIFAKNMASNIFMLFTFADKRKPQALAAIRKGNIEFKQSFKFNNSALYASNDDTDESFEAMWWRMGKTNLKEFMKEVSLTKPQSLSLTKELIEERNKLKAITESIRGNILNVLITLEKQKRDLQQIKGHLTDTEAHEGIIYETCEMAADTDRITDENDKTTRCPICNIDCHPKCSEPTEKCKVMVNGQCRVCPKGCPWQSHISVPFEYKTLQVKKRSLQQIREEYNNRSVKEIEEDFERNQNLVLQYVENAFQCLKRIDEIGMMPIQAADAISLIDVMIREEECQAGLGCRERILQLEEVKKLVAAKRAYLWRFVPEFLYNFLTRCFGS